MHGPIVSEPYYEPYVVRHPLDYGMARTYSGGYIGPGASKVSTVSGSFCSVVLLPLISIVLLRLVFYSSSSTCCSSYSFFSVLSSLCSFPCHVSALRLLSFSSSYRFSYSFVFSSTSSPLFLPSLFSPPRFGILLLLLCPNLQPRLPKSTRVRPGYVFHPRSGASFLRQSINPHLVSVLL